MPLQLTLCSLCARKRPDFHRAIAQLAAAHPDDLLIVELECMAACDDVPAIMIDTDYHPQVSPQNLIVLVRESLKLAL